MRGTDINYIGEKKGFTPIHWAIEENLPSKIIKFLISNGADIH